MFTEPGKSQPIGRRLFTSLFAIATLFTSATACIPRDAGYRDVRRLVERQAGIPISADPKPTTPSPEVRQLLGRPLTEESAARLAVINSPKVAAAMERVGVSRGQLVQAAALPNPVADAALRFNSDSTSLDVGVMQDLTELLLLPRRKGSADAALRAEAYDAAHEIVKVIFGARASLYDYQAQRQLLELQQQLLTSTYAAFEGATRMREAGNITELSLARHQSRYEQARLAAANAENDLFAAKKRLATTLGLWGADDTWDVAAPNEELPSPLTQDAMRRALAANLELRALEHRHYSARQQLTYSRVKGWLPELRAGVAAEREEDAWGVGPALELELPLFYQGQGQVDAAEAMARQIEAQLEDKAIEIRNVSEVAFQRLAATRARLTYLDEELLPLQRRLVHEAQLQYNAMNIGLFELLAAKNDELDVQRQHIVALRDLRLAHNAVEQLFAGGMPAEGAPMTAGDPLGAGVAQAQH